MAEPIEQSGSTDASLFLTASSSATARVVEYDAADYVEEVYSRKDESSSSSDSSSAPSAPLPPHPASLPVAMTLPLLRSLCLSHPDLYDTLELNSVLFLNFGSFDAVDCLDSVADNIRTLFLENNRFTSMLPVAPSLGIGCCVHLRCLYLQNNSLTSLAGLEGLEQLVLLNVSHNQLTSLDGLANLQKLQILDARSNKIVNVDELGRMGPKSRLHTIDLSANKIEAHVDATSNSSPVSAATSGDDAAGFAALSASSTPLSSSSAPSASPPALFHFLALLPLLRVVYLKANPLVEGTHQYRRLLSSMLSSLSFLDDRPVSAIDLACAKAWAAAGGSSGSAAGGGDGKGREAEMAVRNGSTTSYREKEERNHRLWMKQKDERVIQLAELKAAAALNASSSSSLSSSSSSSDGPIDPHYSKRVYHSSSASIPASPYHAEVASVEYSSWLIKQEEIEDDDVMKRGVSKLEEAKIIAKKRAAEQAAVDAILSSVPAPAFSSAPALMPAENQPTSTSSYLDADPSDDPEIVSMKSMLADVLLATRSMKAGGGAGGGAGRTAKEKERDKEKERRKKDGQNFGVNEEEIVEDCVVDEPIVEITAQSTPATNPGPSSSSAVQDDADAELEDLNGDIAAAAANYSILQSKTISQIYDETMFKLPSVDMNDDDDEDDDGDEDDIVDDTVADDDDDLYASIDASSSSSSSVPRVRSSPTKPARARVMPRILGFGPDDAHLLHRSLGMGDEQHEADWLAMTSGSGSGMSASPAVGRGGPRGGSAPTKKTDTSLAAMLDARRLHRLGATPSTSKATSASTNGKVASSTSSSTSSSSSTSTSRPADSGSLMRSFVDTISSATDIAVAASSSSSPDAEIQSPLIRPAHDDRADRNRIFTSISAMAVDHVRKQDDDDDDDDDDSADDDVVAVDPRAAAQEARRVARQQR